MAIKDLTTAQARRPFQRRRKTCPFSGPKRAKDRLQGRASAAALRFRARQDRAVPHHRRFGKKQRELAQAIKRARFIGIMPYAVQ